MGLLHLGASWHASSPVALARGYLSSGAGGGAGYVGWDRQRPFDGSLHVDAGRVEDRHRCVVRADQEVDLGAAVDDPAGPRRLEPADDPAVLIT